MAKPRIFLSSTCYDLSKIRSEIDAFLSDRGFEVINSEGKSFGVSPGLHSHTACLAEVEVADYLLLLVGTKRGGTYIGSVNSITNEEYSVAEKLEIPRIVAVERRVWEYRETYRRNPTGNHSHIVDDVRIFSFIDYIVSGHSDNWIHHFDTIDEIKKIITTQLAQYLRNYSQKLRKIESQIKDKALDLVEFPHSLSAVDVLFPDQNEATSMRNGLRGLHNVMRQILSDTSKQGAKLEKLKQLWVMGRFGDTEEDGESIRLSMDKFKQYAWSYGRARRVNNQFDDYGVYAGWTDDADDAEILLKFKGRNTDSAAAWALKKYVSALVDKYGDKAAEEIFHRADMRMFSA